MHGNALSPTDFCDPQYTQDAWQVRRLNLAAYKTRSQGKSASLLLQDHGSSTTATAQGKP
jgi:hypothetical protein